MKKYILKPFFFIFLFSWVLVTASFAKPLSTAGDAEEMIRDIIAVVGLKANFDVKAADIPNAAAITYNGKRYIAYNPAFISNLNAKAGNKWAAVSILAHEVGHHLNGHTLLPTGSQPALELEADEFSGFVLRKMGATLAQAQAAMTIAADYRPSHTHPAQQDRLLSIAKGWNKAAINNYDLAKYNKNSPVTEIAAAEPAYNSTRFPGTRTPVAARVDNPLILAKVIFPTDRLTTYYVTKQLNLVKLDNSQLLLVGKVMPTNSQQYPFIIKNNRGTLYVHKDGRIFTPGNELAGYLTAG